MAFITVNARIADRGELDRALLVLMKACGGDLMAESWIEAGDHTKLTINLSSITMVEHMRNGGDLCYGCERLVVGEARQIPVDLDGQDHGLQPFCTKCWPSSEEDEDNA